MSDKTIVEAMRKRIKPIAQIRINGLIRRRLKHNKARSNKNLHKN
jgi:hypothetical protein